MNSQTLMAAIAALAMTAAPVAAEAATIDTANPAQALSLSPSVRTGAHAKGEKIGKSGLIVGIGMIALGAGALALALSRNNDNAASR